MLMDKYIELVYHNPLFIILVAAFVTDTLLGISRSIKERRINSSIGIDGLIRKSSMLVVVSVLAFVDLLVGIDVLFWLPEAVKNFLSLEKLGLSEFFSLLFLMFETLSILKNMTIIGLPVPKKVQSSLEDFLNNMTGELDKEL